MSKELICKLAAACMVASASASPTFSQQTDGKEVLIQFVEDSGSANRIAAGDFLRTLSQEIPAATCHLHHGTAIDKATGLLRASIEKFDVLTLALLNGNEAIGIIGGETRRKTIVELEMLIAEWQGVRDAAMTVLEDPTDASAVDIVYASSEIMYEKTYHLSTELEAEYANSAEILQSDVMLLEISGRMAAMTQRMAYEACRIWSGDGNEEFVKDLSDTMQVFLASKVALRDGFPAMGILPAPTAEIAEGLDSVTSDWEALSVDMNAVIAGDTMSAEQRENLYIQLSEKLNRVEDVERLYQDYSKRVIN